MVRLGVAEPAVGDHDSEVVAQKVAPETDAEADGCDDAEPKSDADTQTVGLREERREREGVVERLPVADVSEVAEAHTEEDVERLVESVDDDNAEEDAALLDDAL